MIVTVSKMVGGYRTHAACQGDGVRCFTCVMSLSLRMSWGQVHVPTSQMKEQPLRHITYQLKSYRGGTGARASLSASRPPRRMAHTYFLLPNMGFCTLAPTYARLFCMV